MPPKSKQAARRANAKAAAKGAGKGHVPLDETAERANFERLPPLQRGRIQELAARMAGSFGFTPDQMLPAAVRAGRELPELLDNAMRTGAATPVTVSRGGRIIYHGSDREAMEAARQPGDLISRPSFNAARIVDNLPPHVQEHFQQMVENGDGLDIAARRATAFGRLTDSHIWHVLAAKLDLQSPSDDNEFERKLREFRECGGNYEPSIEGYFPLFRGTAPENHPHPLAFSENIDWSRASKGAGKGFSAFSGHAHRLS